MAFWSKRSAEEAGMIASAPAKSAPPSAQAGPEAQTASEPVTPPPELSAEAQKKAASASRQLLAAFGQVTSILMRSPQHRKHSLADLEWLVVPAVTIGQYELAEAQSKASGMMIPVGVLLWASVSPEVDKRLTDAIDMPMRLKQDEWRCGDHLWVIDAVGKQQVIQAMLKRKMEKDWSGLQVKMKVRDKTGIMRVGVLSASKPPVAQS